MKRRTVEEAIQLGLYLRAQKDALPHGEFLPMIERQFGFHPSTANRYMRQARDAIRVVDVMKRSQ